MVVDVRSAAITAKNYFQSLTDLVDEHQNLRLEEVELSEDKNYWLITLGFDSHNKQYIHPALKKLNIDDMVIYPNYQRQYKIFKINTETGEVESMKIREL